MNIIKRRLKRIADNEKKADFLLKTLDEIKPSVKSNYNEIHDKLINLALTDSDKSLDLFFNDVVYDENLVDTVAIDSLNEILDITNSNDYFDEDFFIDCTRYTNVPMQQQFVKDLQEIKDKILSANPDEVSTMDICGVTINLGTDQEQEIIDSMDEVIEFMEDYSKKDVEGNICNEIYKVTKEIDKNKSLDKILSKSLVESLEAINRVVDELKPVAKEKFDSFKEGIIKSSIMGDYDEVMMDLQELFSDFAKNNGYKVFTKCITDILGEASEKFINDDLLFNCSELAFVEARRTMEQELKKVCTDIKNAMEKDPNGVLNVAGVDVDLSSKTTKDFVNDVENNKHFEFVTDSEIENYKKDIESELKDVVEEFVNNK